ncbi:hypothetical protein CLOM_g21437 [Closterium sp. NIES-68]|nr:hypothetical protein CLOM_g21437 [Closterium sp. NIES-68]
MAAVRAQSAAESAGIERLEITQPDDWHLHVRDGAALQSVVPFSASVFHRAVIMPNLRPPVTTALGAAEYRERVLAAVPEARRGEDGFKPLMTLYLTDDTTPEEVQKAKDGGIVVAFKLYPAGATTNSAAGVTDLFGRCFPAIQHMAHVGMPLLLHGEVVDPSVDMFDREKEFIHRVLSPLLERLPGAQSGSGACHHRRCGRVCVEST